MSLSKTQQELAQEIEARLGKQLERAEKPIQEALGKLSDTVGEVRDATIRIEAVQMETKQSLSDNWSITQEINANVARVDERVKVLYENGGRSAWAKIMATPWLFVAVAVVGVAGILLVLILGGELNWGDASIQPAD